MNQIIKKTRNKIANQKKKYLFLGVILLCGIISGILFLFFISKEDKSLVKDELNLFFQSITEKKLNYFTSFWNSIGSNFLFLLFLWILGISIIGIPVIIFFLFLKGFIFGFSFSSIVSIYDLKGFLLAFFYLVPHHLLLLVLFLLVSFYAINFSIRLLQVLFLKQNISLSHHFKRYCQILGIGILGITVCSLLEVFAVPFFLDFFL